jgi:hypothetical protein
MVRFVQGDYGPPWRFSNDFSQAGSWPAPSGASLEVGATGQVFYFRIAGIAAAMLERWTTMAWRSSSLAPSSSSSRRSPATRRRCMAWWLRCPRPRRALKDPTRGVLATALNEIAIASGVGITVDEAAVPVAAEVGAPARSAASTRCTSPTRASWRRSWRRSTRPAALRELRRHAYGRDAAIIGEVVAEPPAMVVLRTAVGGHRVLDMLAGDALPRIR